MKLEFYNCFGSLIPGRPAPNNEHGLRSFYPDGSEQSAVGLPHGGVAHAYEIVSNLGSSNAKIGSFLFYSPDPDLPPDALVIKGYCLCSSQRVDRCADLDTDSPEVAKEQLAKNDANMDFCVTSISSNTNAFGIAAHRLVARDGTAFEVGRPRASQNPLIAGDVVSICRFGLGILSFANAGFGIPRPLEAAPADVVKKVWAAADSPTPMPQPEAHDTSRLSAGEITK